MNPHCKIGRVRYKSSNVLVLLQQTKHHFYNTFEKARVCIDDDTFAVGFFILFKDRTVESGCAWNPGFTKTDLFGSMSEMSDQLYRSIYGKNNE